MKKGNLYYYFRTRKRFSSPAISIRSIGCWSCSTRSQQSGAAPDAQLRRLIVAFVHTILDELHGTALFLDLEALSPAHLKAGHRPPRPVRSRHAADHRAGNRRPDLRHADAKLASFAILGAVNWIPRWFNPEGPATSHQIADRFADFLIAGLRRTSN